MSVLTIRTAGDKRECLKALAKSRNISVNINCLEASAGADEEQTEH